MSKSTGPKSTGPVLKFRGIELLSFMWSIYARGRITSALMSMPDMPKEADPMDDEAAQAELLASWVEELESFTVRKDGTVKCACPGKKQAKKAPKVPPVSIKDEGTWHCVYCGKEVAEQHSACCSEVGHTEFVTKEN